MSIKAFAFGIGEHIRIELIKSFRLHCLFVAPPNRFLLNASRPVNYEPLPAAAEQLEPGHLAAATILYCALFDDILDRAQSQTYGHAARYLEKLDALAAHDGAASAIVSHETYRAAPGVPGGVSSSNCARRAGSVG
ncbi:MAG: DUF6880 family protein [Methylocella sp.]